MNQFKANFDAELEPLISSDCVCGCCKDAIERLRVRKNRRSGMGLSLLDACWCHLSPTNEQCDCPFCVQVLKISKEEFK